MDMTTLDYIILNGKLANAKDIAKDFRPNTSLDTIIRDYEGRIKEIEKTMEE